MSSVLVVGATGSVGRLAVAGALRAGFETRALVRKDAQVTSFPAGTLTVIGDLTRALHPRRRSRASRASYSHTDLTAVSMMRSWLITARCATS
ncbi:NAD(P)H-binding protein [Specibacter cremeus]|uniref:NAD(P)H-binding protein n=1 Tax=Specibacter cremeus TaxID=1629051 RepID=UPI00197B5E4C